MRVLLKNDFMEKVNTDYGLERRREEELPLDMIDRVTAGVESKKSNNTQTSKEAKCMSDTAVDSEYTLEDLKDILNSKQLERVKAAMGSKRLTQANIEDLKEVKGIGPKTLEKVKSCLLKSENSNKEEGNVTSRAKKLAQEIKGKKEDDNQSQKSSQRKGRGKKYFNVDCDLKADIKGIRLKGHVGVEITDFSCTISTNSNAATYSRCEVYRGNRGDTFDVWGRFSGKLEKAVNKSDKAEFEFYLRGNNLTVTYWRGYKYQDKAKKMAVRAIELLKKIVE